MSYPMFDHQVWRENEEANTPEKVKALTRHDEAVNTYQRWIDWEGVEGYFVQANTQGTLFHFVDRGISIPIRMNVPRYTILSGERYKKRMLQGPYSY